MSHLKLKWGSWLAEWTCLHSARTDALERVWSWNSSAVTAREPGFISKKTWGENFACKQLFNYQNGDPTNNSAKIGQSRSVHRGNFDFPWWIWWHNFPQLQLPQEPSPEFLPTARPAFCCPGTPVRVCVQAPVPARCGLPTSRAPSRPSDRASQSSQAAAAKKSDPRKRGHSSSLAPLTWFILGSVAGSSQPVGSVSWTFLFCFVLNHRAGNSFQAVAFSFHWKGKTVSEPMEKRLPVASAKSQNASTSCNK